MPSGSLSGSNGGSSDNAELSDDKKRIIGGVVGGVGGAILLGALAIVAWRIWGRSKPSSDDSDVLMAGASTGEKGDSVGASPFKATLDQYHNPGAKLNTASNF